MTTSCWTSSYHLLFIIFMAACRSKSFFVLWGHPNHELRPSFDGISGQKRSRLHLKLFNTNLMDGTGIPMMTISNVNYELQLIGSNKITTLGLQALPWILPPRTWTFQADDQTIFTDYCCKTPVRGDKDNEVAK